MLRVGINAATVLSSSSVGTKAKQASRHIIRIHGYHQNHRHHYKYYQNLTSRSFFWGGGSSNNNNDNGNNKNDDENDQKKKNKNSVENETTTATVEEEDDDGDDKSSKTTRKKSVIGSSFSSSNNNSSSGLMRLGFGEDSPRYPKLLALPATSRPLFPGNVASVTLTDETTISAIEHQFNSGAGYLGLFLRKTKKDESSTSDTASASGSSSGLLLDKPPELITDMSDLYNVGSFVQIHRVSRGLPGAKSSSSSSSDGSSFLDDNNNDNEEDDGEDSNLGNTASVLLYAHRRVDLLSVDNVGPPIEVTVNHWNREEYNTNSNNNDTIRALSNEIVSTIREVARSNTLFREHIQLFPSRVDANDPFRFADFAASIATSSPEELQNVLEEKDPEMRLHKVLVIMKKELQVSTLQKEINAKVEEKMSEAQRRYFLTEQLKSIKKELGMEQDDKEILIGKYRKKVAQTELKGRKIPKEIRETIESELEKLSTLEKNSSEFNVTRSYLDWLTDISWGNFSKDNFDLNAAKGILNEDHYGLQDVKDTILQFIAVGKLKGGLSLVQGRRQQEEEEQSTNDSSNSSSSAGKILCLSGPPGVGKTSIASSIAKALNRKFFRFSVGGLGDVSEIKGHRRTYVGAMPGKMIQCLKSAGTMNPLVLIDEIDKLGKDSYRGDPSSALLEVLDPNQNATFRDHFLDVPVDMSKVLFMCTANDLSAIPGPLLDRMEIIQLSGYDVPEKVAIAQEYLLPKAMLDSGLLTYDDDETQEEDKETTKIKNEDDGKDQVNNNNKKKKGVLVKAEGVPESLTIDKGAIEKLVRWYCREAGVRNLEKHIRRIAGKLALQVVAEKENVELSDKMARTTTDDTTSSESSGETWIVSEENLEDYVGKPKFTSDRMYESDPLPSGTCMGLAWTSMGGAALYIETQCISKRRRNNNNDTKNQESSSVATTATVGGGGGNLRVTGQLGNVMSESSQIAHTFSRVFLAELDPTNTFFDDVDIHMHVPEGATPKDGPSAGITMITAMLSLSTKKSVRNDLAMTGEVSLKGKVLPVGGIKEKTMAARRAGIQHIVFPEGNRRDFEEIPEYLKDDLEVHFASDYKDVFEVAFIDNNDNK